MKNNRDLSFQLNYWADCIEMLGPEESPNQSMFEQPMAGLRLVRKPQRVGIPWAQKNARKTKAPVQGLL